MSDKKLHNYYSENEIIDSVIILLKTLSWNGNFIRARHIRYFFFSVRSKKILLHEIKIIKAFKIITNVCGLKWMSIKKNTGNRKWNGITKKYKPSWYWYTNDVVLHKFPYNAFYCPVKKRSYVHLFAHRILLVVDKNRHVCLHERKRVEVRKVGRVHTPDISVMI